MIASSEPLAITVGVAEPLQWDELVQQFPDHTIFHSRAWLDTVAATHGLKVTLAIAQADGECVALWPILEMRKGPLRVLGSPLPGWSTAYLGPLFMEETNHSAIIEAFLNHRLFRRYAYLACKVVDRSRPIDLNEFGFNEVMRFETYRVDLTQSEDQLWDNLKSECRTRIRKAQKLGVEIREETTDQFIEDYWRMSLETFAKAKIQPTHNKRFVEELWTRLQGRLLVLSAFVDNARAGSLVLPFDDHTMYYWGGAAYLKYRDVPAHNLLHWQAINRARSLGLREYDFISTIGGPGRFKRTFGPNVVNMATHWERSPSRLLAALKDRYRNYLLKRRRVELAGELQGAVNQAGS